MKTVNRYRTFDVFLLTVCILMVLLGFLLSPGEHKVSLLGYQIPEICLFKVYLAIECLGCGLTRSFVYTAHGDFSIAIGHHFMGPIVYVICVSQIPYRIWRMKRLN